MRELKYAIFIITYAEEKLINNDHVFVQYLRRYTRFTQIKEKELMMIECAVASSRFQMEC